MPTEPVQVLISQETLTEWALCCEQAYRSAAMVWAIIAAGHSEEYREEVTRLVLEAKNAAEYAHYALVVAGADPPEDMNVRLDLAVPPLDSPKARKFVEALRAALHASEELNAERIEDREAFYPDYRNYL